MISDIDAADLPETLRDIVDMIGLPSTLKLVEKFPGVRVFVPRQKNLEADHHLVQLLGADAAEKLAAYFDGSEYPVPKAAAALIRLRDRKIQQRRGDSTAAELALEFGLTERHVYRVWAAADQEFWNRQERLF